MIENEVPLDDEDAAFAAAEAQIEAMRNGTQVATPEPGGAEPAPESEPEPEPAAEAKQEPFEGFSDLPESARKFYETTIAERSRFEAETKRLADLEAKARNDFDSARGRAAAAQRELAELRKQGDHKPAPPQPRGLSWDEWKKSLAPEEKQWADSFPEDARAAFSMANRVAETIINQRLGDLESQTGARLQAVETRSELQQLEREHKDWREYGHDGKLNGTTPTAKDYWDWAKNEGGDVLAAADSASAADVATAISLHKWTKANPEVQETFASPDFQSWAAARGRAFSSMARSLDISDRADIMNLYIGHLESQVQVDPKTAARVNQISARREQQNRVSPSIRQTVSPAQAAAAGRGEDAEFAAAEARIKQWRQRQ